MRLGLARSSQSGSLIADRLEIGSGPDPGLATAPIDPTPSPTVRELMNTVDIDAIRNDLEATRARLVEQMDELGATPSGDLRNDLNYGDGFADAAATTAERTERLGLVDTLKGQLDEVEEALSRVADGTYGTCASCGEEIPPARLEARPESTLCVACKSKR